MIAKLIANLAVIAMMVGTSILVMIYGWGLTPKNWWWIIGVGIFANTAIRALYDAVNKESRGSRE